MCLIKIFYTKIVQILMLWLYTKLNYYIFEIICMFVGHLLHFINPKYVIINNSYFLKICICNSWRRSCFFQSRQFWQHCFCQWSLKNYCFKEYSTFLDYPFICFIGKITPFLDPPLCHHLTDCHLIILLQQTLISRELVSRALFVKLCFLLLQDHNTFI